MAWLDFLNYGTDASFSIVKLHLHIHIFLELKFIQVDGNCTVTYSSKQGLMLLQYRKLWIDNQACPYETERMKQ